MTENIVQAGIRQVSDVQQINRQLTENTLRMRCLAYLHQVKADLLVETIYDMNNSKKQLAELNLQLEQQKAVIKRQNILLKEKNKNLASDRDLLELKVAERVEAFEKLAHYDSVTNLPNRFLFKDRLKHALTQAQNKHKKIALVLLDLDRFRNINDSEGHAAGDQILRQIAGRLSKIIRSCDTFARLGGDEFVVLIEEFEDKKFIKKLVKQIQSTFNDPFYIGNKKIYLTISLGISFYPSDTNNSDDLLKHADSAMYEAKSTGKNTYCFYSPEQTMAAHSRFSLETELRLALKNDEFAVFYQPQFNLKTKSLSGAEALVRWQHPQKGWISPAEFIWLTEEIGLILEIGNVVLRKACIQTLIWIKSGHFKGRISVNLSAIQFKQPDIVRTVQNILDETGLPANRLEIEITESALIGSMEMVAETLDAFKKIGVALAIDDFGTGYSSLAYLKRFHVDRLKIDQSFVHELPHHNNDVAIVRAIINMGQALGLSVIAEGVEKKEQADFLSQESCDDVQGYFYGRPVNAEYFKQQNFS